MADNITAPAAGEVFATDDIAGVQYPRTKVGFGVDGAYVDVSAGTPLPVTITLPAGAATETTLAALNTKTPALGQAARAASQPVVIASDQTAVPVVDAALVLTGAAAQTAIVNNILPATAGASGTDVANRRAASVQIVSTGTGGTFIFEQSNDSVNWVPLPVFNAAPATAVPITAAIAATASAIVYTFPLSCSFVRLRIVSTITGGSIQAFSRLSSKPWTATAQLLAAGANAIGDVGQQYRANATGAGTLVNLNCPATPVAQTIKASAGRLIGIYLVNTNATMRWLKVFNATAPTLASTTADLRIPLPQNQPVFISFEGGMAFATAITCAITSSGALNLATGAVTLDDVTGFAVFA